MKNKVIFSIISFIFWFSQFLYVPVLSPYLETLGGDYLLIGLILSSYGFLQLLCRLPLGILADYMKIRKPFILLGILASTISCLIFFLTEDLVFALIARCFAGLAAATWVVFTVMYASYYHEHESNQAMNLISFIVVFAQLLGMGLSGYLVSQWGWHAPYFLGSLLCILAIVLLLFISEPKHSRSRSQIELKSLLFTLKKQTLLQLSFLSILAHAMIFITTFGFTSAYALSIGIPKSQLGLTTFSFMIPHAIAPLIIGKIASSIRKQWMVLIGSFMFATMCIFTMPITTQPAIFYIIQAMMGLSLGFIFPLLLGMCYQSASDHMKSTVVGAYQAIYAIGIFGGPFIAGIFNSWFGLSAGFYFAVLLGGIATLLAARWKSKAMKHNIYHDSIGKI